MKEANIFKISCFRNTFANTMFDKVYTERQFSPLKTMCVTLKNGNNSFPFRSNLKIWQWHFHAYFKILQIIFTGRNKYNRYWMNQSTLYAFIFLIFNVTISSFLNFQSNMKAIKCLFVKILLLSALSVAIIVTIMNIF